VKTLVRECFGDNFYTLLFVTVSVQFLYESSGSPFTQPMLVAQGVNLDTLGKISTATGFITLVLTLITANWGDRWHPMPLMLLTAVLLVVTAPFGLLFLIPGLSPDAYMWIMVTYNATHIPISVIGGLAAFPFFMVMFPKDRYGQFSAAMCTVRSILAGILGSILAGGFMKLMAYVLQHGNSNDQYYLRYCFVWKMFFQAVACGLYLKLYREWKRKGGREGFKPAGPTAA
jgi:MFS family permease